jgi:hypothetical protein
MIESRTTIEAGGLVTRIMDMGYDLLEILRSMIPFAYPFASLFVR